MHKPYTAYTSNISVNDFYWLRRANDLNLKLVRVKKIVGENITVVRDNDQLVDVEKNELLEFDPTNRLFKCLMKNTTYRHDHYLRSVLHNLKFNPEVYMIKEREQLCTIDSLIEKNIFYNEYAEYTKTEGSFCDELMPQIQEVTVTGTLDLSVYELYKKVCENGGMERITNDQKWKSLFYSKMSKTNVSYTIRTFYKKFLYEFEILRREAIDEIDYQYKFQIKDRIYINVKEDVYYGTVKLRRNCGLNQYYIQFYLWSRENSEWFSEDVLNKYAGFFTSKNYLRRKTRSSKANNLIDDPLTREKHSHLGNKLSKQEHRLYENDKNFYSKQNKENFEKRNTRAMSYFKPDARVESNYKKNLANKFIDFQSPNNFNDCYSIKNEFIIDNLSASMGTREKKETKENKMKNIMERTTSKRKQKIIKMLQDMDILDERGKMTEENYMFLSFFNL